MYKKTTKKNKINRQRNKNKSVKNKKKGGNRSFKKHSLANELPDNLANEQNERILGRIRADIQYCIERISELELQKEILFQEKTDLEETLSHANDNKTKSELYNEIERVYKEINKIQNEMIKLYDYRIEFTKILDILSNTGEELTPDGREMYIDRYKDLTMKLYQSNT
jgi:chromosome segregation ATPase